MALKRNIITTFLTQFPVMIFTLITGVIITRLIGVAGKGVYTVFIANIQLLALFFSLSANSGIIYFISNKEINKQKILGLTIYTFLFSVIIGAVIVFVPLHQEKLLLPEGFNHVAFKIYLFISFLFTVTSTLFSGIFQGYKMYSVINKVAIINASLNMLVFGLLMFTKYLYLFESILLNVLFYTVVVYFLNTILWVFFYLKLVRILPTLRLLKIEIQVFFKYIGIGHVSNMLNFFNYRLDIWFVNSYHGLEQLGLYSLGVNVAQILLLASTPITSVLFPYLSAEKEKLKKIKLVALFSRINTLGLSLGVVFMLLTGRYIIPLVYGSDFTGAIVIFDIMIFASLFRGLTKMFSTYLASEGKVVYNLYATIIGFIITIVFNIVLVPKYGVIGAAVSSLFTYFGVLGFVYYKTRLMNLDYNFNFFIINKDDFGFFKRMIVNGKR
ncbi:MAG: polysaccharide biosynthesis C-terminal domain-containing protein [Methylococcales bacterium]